MVAIQAVSDPSHILREESIVQRQAFRLAERQPFHRGVLSEEDAVNDKRHWQDGGPCIAFRVISVLKGEHWNRIVSALNQSDEDPCKV